MKVPEIEALRVRTAKSLVPVVLVASDDAGVRDEVVRIVVADLKARGAVSVAVMRHEFEPPQRASVYEDLARIARQSPLFGDGFVFVVEHRAPAVAPDALKAFLLSPAPHVRLVLCLDRKDEKSGLARLVREASGEVVAPKDLKERDAVQTAMAEAQARGLRLHHRAAAALVDLAGTDRGAIVSAIEALACYKGECGEVQEDDLVGLVRRTRREVPWALDEAIGARDLRRTLKIAHRRLQDDQNLLPILHSIARVVRRLLQAKDLVARKVPDEEAQKHLDIGWAFQWERLREAQAHYTEEELSKFLSEVPRFEVLAKRGHIPAEALLAAIVTGLISSRPQ